MAARVGRHRPGEGLTIEATVGDGVPGGSGACPVNPVTAGTSRAQPRGKQVSPTPNSIISPQLAGIDPIWWDVDGGYHKVGSRNEACPAVRDAPARHDTGDLNDSMARLTLERALPPVVTARAQQTIPVKLGPPRPAWITLLREDGSLERFRATEDHVLLPPQPIGRHRILNEDRPDPVCHLTVAPDTCYLPPPLLAGERRFGLAAHLYTLRSAEDQGIGDFTTLARLAAEAARAGASVLGLNPLHALFPHDRSRASPYQPSDRRFLDPIYIDVSGYPNGAAIPSPQGPVDYPAVWNAKRAVLRAAFKPDDNDAICPGPPALRDVRGNFGNTGHLRLVEMADASCATRTTPASPPSGPITGRASHSTLSCNASRTSNLPALPHPLAGTDCRWVSIGISRSVPRPDGAEAWSAQDTLMHGVSVGAPPDPFATQGQIWCLPPPDPVAMRSDGYSAFRELLVANMRHAGALRIDHVMGLRRLFVIPDGASGKDGAYVTYPLEDLLAQVALESQRAKCLVVGEDLGTVPEGMPETLAASNILSYSVLWFQRRDGRLRPSAEWRRLAAACVTTHDLATLAGWWNGADIAEKRALSLLDDLNAERIRADEKTALIALLRQENLLTGDVDPQQPMPVAFAAAVHAFVSATPALLALVQVDDLAGETVAVNLPATDRERPNWRRRLDIDVAELCQTPLARAILSAMQIRAAPR